MDKGRCVAPGLTRHRSGTARNPPQRHDRLCRARRNRACSGGSVEGCIGVEESVMLPNPPRVCLIIPPSPFLLDERVFMSLGILKVAASVEARGGYVEVLDLSGYANFID